MVIMTTTGEKLTGSPVTKIDDNTTVTETKTETKIDKDTTFDFLDDTLEIGEYKIKYKYIIGGVLLMVLLMKK
jgi:hypothetical protein